jgi:N-acetylglucosaminyl-diphospho-decaprenol L-rhamnosyltransferase
MEESVAPPLVTVLIVSHNNAPALRRTIESLEKSPDRGRIEVLVVDKGSFDESPTLDSEFPNTVFLRLPRNFGLSKALNIGMRTAKSELVFFLAPGVEVQPDTVAGLAARLEASSEATAVAPLILSPEGKPLPQMAKLPVPETMGASAGSAGWARSPASASDAEGTAVVFPSLRALMVRLWFLKGLRYIDERYGEAWADAEICFQIRRAGKKILLFQQYKVVESPEEEGISDPRIRALISADWTLGAARYAEKHFGFAAGLSIRLSSVLRALGGFAAALVTFGEVRYRFSLLGCLIAGQKIDGTQGGY